MFDCLKISAQDLMFHSWITTQSHILLSNCWGQASHQGKSIAEKLRKCIYISVKKFVTVYWFKIVDCAPRKKSGRLSNEGQACSIFRIFVPQTHYFLLLLQESVFQEVDGWYLRAERMADGATGGWVLSYFFSTQFENRVLYTRCNEVLKIKLCN